MSPLRRSINLGVALALAAGGTVALAYLLFFAAAWRLFMPLGAGFVAWLGFYWLWIDFIRAEPLDSE